MRRTIQADLTLIDGALEPDIIVRIDRGGTIASVQRKGDAPRPGSTEMPAVSPAFEAHARRSPSVKRLRGRILLPGFVNAHSHAFQRLLRGRTERRAPGREGDDFWSWREAMYQVTEVLTPEDVETVSRLTFLEMKLAGFTHVAEFHYLHHQPGGHPYADPAELARRVLAGAEFAGIGITLLRVAYQRAGPGRPPSPQQLRFIDPDIDAFARNLEATEDAVRAAGRDIVSCGLAAHSVRALDRPYLEGLGALVGDRVIHAHVSEQPRENELCQQENGLSPLGLLEEAGLLGPRFTAIHATHLAPGDAARLGRAGAGACICPTTERNLGDGLPNLHDLREAGVVVAVGSDSQVRIDPFAELRMLEDGERLRTLRRNVLVDPSELSVAPALFAAASSGGARAAGLGPWGIRAGARADLVAVRTDGPALAGIGCGDDASSALLSALALGGHPRSVSDVWVSGRHEVQDGECLRWEQACKDYQKVAQRIFG